MLRQKTKSVFFSLIIVILIFITLEVLLKIFDLPRKNPKISENYKVVKTLFPQYVNYFCDNHHKKESAQAALYKCLNNELNSEMNHSRSVWIFGGSTTQEEECDVPLNWTKQMAQEHKETKFLNFSESGMSSDMMVGKLTELLNKETAPEMIFLGLFVNPEAQTYWDKRDVNYDKLKNQINPKSSKSESWLLWLFQMERIIYDNVRTYRWFQSKLSLPRNELGEFVEILWLSHRHNGEEEKTTEFDAHNPVGLFTFPKRYFWSEDSFRYSLINFELNLNAIKSLAQKNKSQVVCVLQPYIKNFYQNKFPSYDITYTKWATSFYDKTKELCTNLGFKVIDGQSCIDQEVR